MQIRVSRWQLLQYDASFKFIESLVHTAEKLVPDTWKKCFGPYNFTLVQIIIYRCSEKKWATDTTHFGFRTHDGTSSAISEIMTQAAARIKKLVQSRFCFICFFFFFGLGL